MYAFELPAWVVALTPRNWRHRPSLGSPVRTLAWRAVAATVRLDPLHGLPVLGVGAAGPVRCVARDPAVAGGSAPVIVIRSSISGRTFMTPARPLAASVAALGIAGM